jgi:hypothetical protein
MNEKGPLRAPQPDERRDYAARVDRVCVCATYWKLLGGFAVMGSPVSPA